MSRFLALGLLLCILPRVHAQTPPRTTSVKLNGHTFTLPEGFTIELAAQAPLVDRPVSASFDEQGRLYVTVSSGANDRGPEQAVKKMHHVVRLEDSDGDGVFDKSIVFADKIAMPQGALWHQGSLYVAAPPHILKLTDTRGDGKADRREIWFDGKTVTGCMNDLHGPWLGPEGWIYWTKGAFAPQTYTIHGKEWKTRASHVFRARPDGSGLEPLMTGGMDNPVGLAFTQTGDRIVSGTFFQHPADGKRDGLIHAIYGGIFGKDWDVIHDPQHRWTSPRVLPIMTHLGAAAPCGMIRFEAAAFGKDYQDNFFVCLFNLQKVTRHVLIPDGATYKTRDFDFVVSDQKDFHPTDVVEAPDGSLVIVDTGGWYKICCPTSQLLKPDVLGAIYRVRKTGTAKLADPLGKKIAWDNSSPEELCKLLDDSRVFVKRRAIEVLGKNRLAASAALQNAKRSGSPEATRSAQWALVRTEVSPLDPNIFWQGVISEDLLKLPLQRADFEWLALRSARDPLQDYKKRWVTRIMDEVATTSDPWMEHALIYALIQLQAHDATMARLKDANPRVRRAALTALDQMDGGNLEAKWVVADLDAEDSFLRATAWWIVSRRPEWGAEVAKHMEKRLALALRSPAPEREQFVQQLAQLSKSKAIQDLLADSVLPEKIDPAVRVLALRVMARANVKEAPPLWLAALAAVFTSNDQELLREATATARALRLPKELPDNFGSTLRAIGTSAGNTPMVRLTSLAAIPGGLSQVGGPLFAFLQEQLQTDQPAGQRNLAAEVLSKARLDSAQLVALAGVLKAVGPLELDRLLDAFAQSQEDKVGRSLLDALETPSLRPALRVDMVKTRLARFSPEIRKRSESLLHALNADLGKQQARLEELLGQTKSGNVSRGQVVFNSQKTACMVCHAIGYVGGKVGPDLTRIGGLRSQRDLLEAIVFPSASFVRSYEPIVVITTSGKSHNGLIKKDNAEELVLVTGPNQEVRIPRAEIEEIHPSKVSIMPSGLDQQLSVRDLADLIAFLGACK